MVLNHSYEYVHVERGQLLYACQTQVDYLCADQSLSSEQLMRQISTLETGFAERQALVNSLCKKNDALVTERDTLKHTCVGG